MRGLSDEAQSPPNPQSIPYNPSKAGQGSPWEFFSVMDQFPHQETDWVGTRTYERHLKQDVIPFVYGCHLSQDLVSKNEKLCVSLVHITIINDTYSNSSKSNSLKKTR